jgi:hypothetical protein
MRHHTPTTPSPGVVVPEESNPSIRAAAAGQENATTAGVARLHSLEMPPTPEGEAGISPLSVHEMNFNFDLFVFGEEWMCAGGRAASEEKRRVEAERMEGDREVDGKGAAESEGQYRALDR